MSAVEDGPDAALRKLSQQPGVLGYVVLSKKGKPIILFLTDCVPSWSTAKSEINILSSSGIPVKFHNMDNAKALHYAALLERLTATTREFLDKRLFQPDDDAADLKSLRLHTLNHEIVICPEENYTLVVLHKAGEEDSTVIEAKPAEAEEAKKEEEPENNE